MDIVCAGHVGPAMFIDSGVFDVRGIMSSFDHFIFLAMVHIFQSGPSRRGKLML